MNVGMYQAAAALSANDRWQEQIAENLTSSSIPGFKKQEVSFAAVQAGLLPTSGAGQIQGAGHFILPKSSSRANLSPGEMRYTGGAMDLAIDGRAFFEVQLPNGGLAYTRNGGFQVSALGQLVTQQGNVVMGEDGPIQIELENGEPVSISSTGEVSQGGDIKGQLRLIEFGDENRLTQLNGALFAANDPAANASPAVASTVRQGWLEGSNASVVLEMANLLTAMRTFEANQRVIQLQDDRMNKAINALEQG